MQLVFIHIFLTKLIHQRIYKQNIGNQSLASVILKITDKNCFFEKLKILKKSYHLCIVCGKNKMGN
jgi:hypothetical protein